jgi:glycosyltransferase involved in cell wall biosynthesis
MEPKISVIMSVFDGSRYLRRAVSSVLEQNFGDFEFLIADDNSSDSTNELISEMARSDNRIRIFRNEENIGLTRSLNRLLSEAGGEFIARIDADDVSLEGRFQKQIDAMESGSLDFLASCCRIVDENENELYSMCPGGGDVLELKWSLIFRNNIRHSTVMWRKKHNLKYDERFRHAQDYEMWCRMGRLGLKFGIVTEVLADIRSRKDSISENFSSSQDEFACGVTQAQASHYLGREITAEEARNLRLVYSQRDGRQYQDFSGLSESELRNAVELYLDASRAFFEKECVEKNSMASRMAIDLNSILNGLHKNSILIETFEWFEKNRGEFATLVNENFLKVKEEDWQSRQDSDG